MYSYVIIWCTFMSTVDSSPFSEFPYLVKVNVIKFLCFRVGVCHAVYIAAYSFVQK